MSVDEHERMVWRLFDEVWNVRGLDRVEEPYAPDVVVDYRPYSFRTGWEGIRSQGVLADIELASERSEGPVC